MSASESQPPLGSAAAVLEHPLPAGMRDLLPPEAAQRRAIERVFLESARLWGYELVEPPAVEYARALERGLGALDPREIVRFVEPETGEVVALRPDVTPQIARLCATRLEQRPTPYRLAYAASVVRRRAGTRARTHRQIDQLGVELIGAAGAHADLEPLLVAIDALAVLGLGAYTIDLGHAGIVRKLVAPAPPALGKAIADALSRKDAREVATLARALPSAEAEALAALPEMHGAPSLLAALPRCLRLPTLEPELAALSAMVAGLEESLGAAPDVRIAIDLGDVRDLGYYTGAFFQLLAEGPGVPMGAGGRYDKLLARFGRPLPATGLAFDVDALVWALRVARAPILAPTLRVSVAGAHAARFASELRASRIAAAICEAGDGRCAEWRVEAESLDRVRLATPSGEAASVPWGDALARLRDEDAAGATRGAARRANGESRADSGVGVGMGDAGAQGRARAVPEDSE